MFMKWNPPPCKLNGALNGNYDAVNLNHKMS